MVTQLALEQCNLETLAILINQVGVNNFITVRRPCEVEARVCCTVGVCLWKTSYQKEPQVTWWGSIASVTEVDRILRHIWLFLDTRCQSQCMTTALSKIYLSTKRNSFFVLRISFRVKTNINAERFIAFIGKMFSGVKQVCVNHLPKFIDAIALQDFAVSI